MEEFKGKRLFLYNLSTAGWVLLDSIWLTFAIVFLLPPKERVAEGMIPFVSNERFLGIITVLGAVMLFGRIVDAVADPLVASWTDRSTSRFGRRRFFFTVYVVPYLALIPELGHNEKARIGITTAQGYFSLIGSAVVMIGGPLLLTLFMQNTDYVGSYRKMVICLAIPGALLLYAAVFAVDEKRFSNARSSKVPLIDSFKKTVRNKAFIIYLLANMSLWFLFNIVRSSAIPIVITLMGADEAFASNMFTILFVIAAICFPVVGFLTRIRGKKVIMIISLGLFSIFSIFLSLTGLTPVNPKTWGLIFVGLMGIPTAALIIIPNVILSELCDVDYKKTGERREAMYFGVQGFFMKLNLGLSTASLALLYSIFGKDIINPLGVRLAPVLGSIVAILGLIIMTRYPEKQIKDILSK
jgi:GPH family glycoside/pentoside/hexuronide:cation symporter